MKKIHLVVLTLSAGLATSALAQAPSATSQERESDRIINHTAPNAAAATQERESKPPADSTMKSQSGEASPNAESK